MRLQSCFEVLFCLEGGRLFMREIINSGNSTVDAMAKINLTGNIIPANWFRTITRYNGKPYMLAICILSELCYWYRPQEVRDERSGNIVEYRKRFRGDMLQKNYQDLADRFGESKRSVKAATDRLEELGVIRKEWRNLKLRNGAVINNVLFIDLNVDILSGLTFGYSESVEEISEEIAQSEENTESEEIENPEEFEYSIEPEASDKSEKSEAVVDSSLDELSYARNKVRNKIRRATEDERPDLYEKLAEMNIEIKQQRKTIYYLKDIENSIPQMEQKISHVVELYKSRDRENNEYRSERVR